MSGIGRIVIHGVVSLGLSLPVPYVPRLIGGDGAEKAAVRPGRRVVFQSSVNAVVVNVTATDKDGKPVTDLTRDEFKVYDNNVPQQITSFAMESFAPPETPETEAPLSLEPLDAKPPVTATNQPKKQSGAKQQAAPSPRMLSIVIDDLTMEDVLDLARTVDAVRKFVRDDMGGMDQVSIVSASRSVQIPFTDDKQRLLRALDSVPGRFNKNVNDYYDAGSDEFMSELVAWHWIHDGEDITCFFCQEGIRISGCANPEGGKSRFRCEFNRIRAQRITDEGQFRTQELLYTISRNLRTLKHFEGNRMLILFSDGFLSERGSREEYQLQELIDLAMKSGIVLNTVSTRGLELRKRNNMVSGADARESMMSKSSHGDPLATEALRAQQGSATLGLSPYMTSTLKQQADAANIAAAHAGFVTNPVHRLESWEEANALAQHSSLARMADETGGLFFNDNSLSDPLREIAGRSSTCYVLTYNMPPDKSDNGRHDVRVEVTRPGVRLGHRKGYLSPRGEVSFESDRKEDILAAIGSPGDMKEVPLTLSYNYSLTGAADGEGGPEYTLSLIANADIRNLEFAQEDGRQVNQISIVWVVYDEADRYVRGLERVIDFKLQERNHKELRERGLTSKAEFRLPMGRYKTKAVVRDENRGKMGSAARVVEIP